MAAQASSRHAASRPSTPSRTGSARGSTITSAPANTTSSGSTDEDSDARTPSSTHDDHFFDGSMDPFMCDPMWSWVAPEQDHAMDMGEMDGELSQWLSNAASASTVDAQNFADYDPSYPFPPAMIAEPEMTFDSKQCISNPGAYHSRHQNGSRSSIATTGSLGNGSPSSRLNTAIARLSQLNLRLCALHRTSSALSIALKARGGDSPIVDDEALKSVTGWLSHISGDVKSFLSAPDTHESMSFATTSVGSTLRDTFSASHHLLDILRDLHIDPSMVSSSFNATQQHPGMMPGYSQRNGMPDSHMAKMETDGSESALLHNTVVDQLVVSCHTLLLNIFVSVFNAILCDSDKWNPAAPLADIRPVLISQVCSYLIGRQNQAVDIYLSQAMPQPDTSMGQWADQQMQQTMTPGAATAAFRAELAHLREEIEKRQTILKQALRIS